MGRQLVVILVALGAGTLLPVASAQHGAAAPSPAEGMALAVTDFPSGATLLSQEDGPLPYLPHAPFSSAYTRSFGAVSADGVRIASVISSVVDYDQAAVAARFMLSLRLAVGSQAGRALVAGAIKKELAAVTATSKTAIRSTELLRARALSVPHSAAVDIAFAFTTSAASIEFAEIFVQQGSALELVVYVTGEPGVPAAEDASLAHTVAARITEASAPPPANTVPPAISGTLQPGEILSASPGSWTGTSATTSYGYQWYRCTAAGQACVAIPGASASTYTVTVGNSGLTLSVSATATAPSGATTAMSQPTGLIS